MWLWIVMLCAWVGFVAEVFFDVRSPLSLQLVYVFSMLTVWVYALYHCWTNTNIAFRTKLNWLPAIFMTWILGATGYIFWWRFHASKRVQLDVRAIDGAPVAVDRLRRLTSRKILEFMRFILILAWLSLGLVFVLFIRGSTLSSVEVLIPLLLGLSTNAIAMIWAVKVVEIVDEEMHQGERLLWIVFIAATWTIGVTIVWLKIRSREVRIT